ncbi:MAG: hypothetical protein HOH33_02600 [Verrucomicrobia bacterium]|nr:hypothetical protein [Verrucomicrobiota bacterium]
MIYAQISRSIGLNDVCDSIQIHSGPLSQIRGARPPSRWRAFPCQIQNC